MANALKAAVSLMLPAKAQIVIFWGPELVALYNDAYAPTIGDKHPRALGRPARENWAELWDDLEPLLRRVLETGETVFAKDRPFYIERHGYPESVYFDISYSPVWDEAGKVGGVLCIVSETTERVVAQRTSTPASSGDEPPSQELVRHDRRYDRSERSVSPNATGIRAGSSRSACCALAGQRTGPSRDHGH